MFNAAGGTLTLAGTWTGTVQFEFSTDNVTWNALTANPNGGGTAVSSAVGNGVWAFSNTGFANIGVRLRAATITVGSATATCNTVANGSSSNATVTGTASTTIVDSNNVNAVPASKNAVRMVGTQSGDAINVSPVDASGNPIVPSVCGSDSSVTTAAINVSSNADSNGGTTIVALSNGKIVYVCGIQVVAGAAVSVLWQSGTGTNCATTQSAITGAMAFATNGGSSAGFAGATIMKTASSANLCLKLGASQSVQGWVAYVLQ
jgi:hypothetical protein